MRSAVARGPAPSHRGRPTAVLAAPALVAGGAGLAWFAAVSTGGLPAAFWIMAALAVLAEARPFTPADQRRYLTVGPSAYLGYATLLAWGLGPATAVLAAAAVTSWLRARAGWRLTLAGLGQSVLAAAAAVLVLRVGDLSGYGTDVRVGGAAIATAVLGAAVWVAVCLAVTTAALRWRYRTRFRAVVARPATVEWWSYAGLLLLSPVVVVAADVSVLLVPLAAVPLLVAQQVVRLTEQRGLRADRDPLTGLGNRDALVREVNRALDRRAATGSPDPLALLLLDLDRFKRVNSTLGHRVGDRVLAEVGARLHSVVGPGDEVVRLGGDEFAVLARRVSGAADARALANVIVAALSEPVRLDGLPLEVSGSVGIAVYPDHGEDEATLLRHAEVAMYDAKSRAAPVAVYQPESDQNSPQRLELLADLRDALDAPGGAGVQMYYQPQVALRSGEVVGVEALLRWHHPRWGAVRPDELIRIAEHTDVMHRLTLHIVDEVVEQVAKWSAAGVPLRASVNISIRDLHTGEVAERIARRLRRYNVPASRFQLEITEGALMADPQRVLATIAALDRLGVAISLDDFGTGYSSLQHLRRLPLAEVKVDRSFVLGMATDADDEAIVTSIIRLAGALGLRVVAEGVEDEATWRRLAEAGCHVGQGWFFARPMPADELLPWLARYRPVPAPGTAGPRA